MAFVRDFGAKGDGKTDDTGAIQHALSKGDGQLTFGRGEYLITRPLLVPLAQLGRLAVDGAGGTARLLMAGAGPALHLIGTHRRTAEPGDFEPAVWDKERMPTVRDLEIVGRHRDADGIQIEGTMQATLHGLLIRRCRHGIHLLNRDRNVIVADCHVYDNHGVGLLLDRVNLHQINVHGNHISYCRQGGIQVVGSEVRNLQIVGNDIEYNYDLKAETSADVLFDCRNGTIREGTISGNTIQAKQSPGGANVRFVGAGRDNPGSVGMFAITGNLIGSQETLLHLQACRGVVVSGNALYNGFHHALRAEDAEHLVIGPNSIDHNPDYKGKSTDAVVLHGCRHVTVSGLLLQHTREPEGPADASIEIHDCEGVSVTGCQVVNARSRGLLIRNSSVVRVADCTVRGRQDDAGYRAAVAVDAESSQVLLVNNFVGRGSDGAVVLPRHAGTASGNLTLA
jgi:nitrous oxidase accessory protein NosD